MNDVRSAPAEAEQAAASEGRSAIGEVRIDAPIEDVWQALTDPVELARWFPLNAKVEPGPEGSIWMSWLNEFVGTSRILAWEPPTRLLTTWGEVDGGLEPGQRTEYVLRASGGSTFLRVVTSGFSDDPSWDAWLEGTRRGWRFELSSLKHYLESHRGQDREVVYLRRRVALSQAVAWERLTGPGGLDPSSFGGTAVDEEPPVQYAALTERPRGLLRMSMEPCHDGPDGRDVTLWLSVWGDHGADLNALKSDWTDRLERLFPEGRFA
ncbi:MAG: SRPBCC domain-containing protein [Gemmatimonadota bacterium]